MDSTTSNQSIDQETADKFASSWNNVYDPSVYTKEQFLDWIAPWDQDNLAEKSVLELGCGSGALLFHMKDMGVESLIGLDLGSSVETATKLLGDKAQVEVADITKRAELEERFGQRDRVYSIGVLHHLTVPEDGVDSLIALTKPGGSFHGWVYAHEGNWVIRSVVDPIRKVVNHFPWWLTKFLVALPLALPFFMYSKFCTLLNSVSGTILPLPMFSYMIWIGKRGFSFHHHVAFDQLVTPMTHYINKERVEKWLEDPRVLPESRYVIFRNGNGWKFGGKIKT
ncbi:MAG: class I SAM-dependent methyltransferase [Planctomycetes bacterium]|nr:class I SAM-dependent methyltransferase [Planctomycetota bacterium]